MKRPRQVAPYVSGQCTTNASNGPGSILVEHQESIWSPQRSNFGNISGEAGEQNQAGGEDQGTEMVDDSGPEDKDRLGAVATGVRGGIPCCQPYLNLSLRGGTAPFRCGGKDDLFEISKVITQAS